MERIEYDSLQPSKGLSTTLAEHRSGNCGVGVLLFAFLAVTAALFLPMPLIGLADLRIAWLKGEHVEPILALGVLTVGLCLFRRRYWPHARRESRNVRNAILLVVPQAVLIRAAIELAPAAEKLAWSGWPRESWLWMPWFLITAFAVILLGSRFGVLTSFTGALLLFLAEAPGRVAVISCMVSSLAGAALLRRCPTRSRVLRAGIGSGLFLGAIAAAQYGLAGAAPEVIAGAGVTPVIVGLASAFVVLAFLPMLEWMLGEVSDVSLVEFGSDHPLLDKLKEQAPGTWHHTLNVADLAEKAAMAIGARALFCKTAALYHDIGKLKDPDIFAENIHGSSPHETLDPRVSAQRIIEHVTYGLELARKHGLPSSFRAIIAEHHGVSLVQYFYAKACAQLREGEDLTELRAAFCYPGPPPSTRESGIIALADIVEAATRSTTMKSDGEMRNFVARLIADRVSNGEFAQCPLTLVELARIEEAFAKWLKGRNHYRPAYPRRAVSSSVGNELAQA